MILYVGESTNIISFHHELPVITMPLCNYRVLNKEVVSGLGEQIVTVKNPVKSELIRIWEIKVDEGI